jgi:hypothetical protein
LACGASINTGGSNEGITSQAGFAVGVVGSITGGAVGEALGTVSVGSGAGGWEGSDWAGFDTDSVQT